MLKIRIEISARHAHLTQHDLEKLFGEGYELKKAKDLSQRGEFASTETVTLVGPKGRLENVRVIGPCRGYTQIEVSKTDSYYLGVKTPLRLSGKIIRSGAIKIVGAKSELELEEGLIVPKRHIKANRNKAAELNLTNGQVVKVKTEGPRALVFEEVEVRVGEDFDELVFSIDTDEANAAGLEEKTDGEILI